VRVEPVMRARVRDKRGVLVPQFVDGDCAPIPETLLEAELFGYARGVFTDARQAKPGLVGQPENTDRFVDALLGALRKVPEGS
jgi:transcriptional regulator with GAF, ATPase, and Fis domain